LRFIVLDVLAISGKMMKISGNFERLIFMFAMPV
jgi:hypothetical protein